MVKIHLERQVLLFIKITPKPVIVLRDSYRLPENAFVVPALVVMRIYFHQIVIIAVLRLFYMHGRPGVPF